MTRELFNKLILFDKNKENAKVFRKNLFQKVVHPVLGFVFLNEKGEVTLKVLGSLHYNDEGFFLESVDKFYDLPFIKFHDLKYKVLDEKYYSLIKDFDLILESVALEPSNLNDLRNLKELDKYRDNFLVDDVVALVLPKEKMKDEDFLPEEIWVRLSGMFYQDEELFLIGNLLEDSTSSSNLKKGDKVKILKKDNLEIFSKLVEGKNG